MNLLTYEELKKTTIFFLLQPSKAFFIFILLVFITILLFLFWIFFAPLNEVIKGQVFFRPMTNISCVKCISNGELYEKNYKNNEEVKKGDLLFSLDTTTQQAELELCKKQYEKCNEDMLLITNLLYTINYSKLPDINKNSESYIRCLTYLTEYNRFTAIINDYAERLRREENKPKSLIVPNAIVDLKNLLQQQNMSFDNWKNQEMFNALEQEKSLKINQKNLRARITELERQIKNSMIYAPIQGRIYEITKKNIGDYILSGENIIKIVPIDSQKIKAEIYVEPIFIPKVKIGNTVIIKCQGLPPSKYGIIESRVDSISPDTILVDGKTYFIVETVINNPVLKTKSGKTARLIPGLTGEGKIVVDNNTAFKMALEKLDFLY